MSDEIRAQIRQDLMLAYQAKFGDDYLQHLTKNLRPSPVRAIAERYGVSQKVVAEIKHSIWMLGVLLAAAAEGSTVVYQS